MDSSEPSQDFAQSVTSRGRHMPLRYWQRAWKKGGWIRHLSGATLPHSTAQRGVDAWISSLRESRASRSPAPGSSEGSKMSVGYGLSLRQSFGTWDHASSSWRTCQDLFGTALPLSSEDWPSSGSMRGGECFQQPPVEPPISASDSSFLPTATATANQMAPSMQKWKGCRNLLPTPTATPYGRNKGGASPDGKERLSLDSMARRGMWPTPIARDHRSPKSSQRNRKGTAPLVEQVGGTLNPSWVEWLMGFPFQPGWTDCEPSATPSCPLSQSEHSEPSTGDSLDD